MGGEEIRILLRACFSRQKIVAPSNCVCKNKLKLKLYFLSVDSREAGWELVSWSVPGVKAG